jgi:hypothetical protein
MLLGITLDLNVLHIQQICPDATNNFRYSSGVWNYEETPNFLTGVFRVLLLLAFFKNFVGYSFLTMTCLFFLQAAFAFVVFYACNCSLLCVVRMVTLLPHGSRVSTCTSFYNVTYVH